MPILKKIRVPDVKMDTQTKSNSTRSELVLQPAHLLTHGRTENEFAWRLIS